MHVLAPLEHFHIRRTFLRARGLAHHLPHSGKRRLKQQCAINSGSIACVFGELPQQKPIRGEARDRRAVRQFPFPDRTIWRFDASAFCTEARQTARWVPRCGSNANQPPLAELSGASLV
jgi:hypothetical protein